MELSRLKISIITRIRFKCNLLFVPIQRGSCSGVFTRWYYDKESDTCRTFTFHGCKGNKNNFASEEKCMEVCGPERTSTGMESFEEAREAANGEGWSTGTNEDAAYAERKRPCKGFLTELHSGRVWSKYVANVIKQFRPKSTPLESYFTAS